jgi:hypothetical protein
MTISCLILLIMRNFSKMYENQNMRFMFGNFFSENRILYDIMWKNMVQPDRPQKTIQYGAVKMQEYIHTLTYLTFYVFHGKSG